MTVEVEQKANAGEAAPAQDIDLDRAAEEAEQRLAGETEPKETPPVEEPAKKEEPPPVTEEPATEPPTEPVAEPEGEPQGDPGDHRERTKLGRKVAKLEDALTKQTELITRLLERTVPQSAPQPQAPPPEPEYVDLSSPEGLSKFLDMREQQRAQHVQQDRNNYQVGYASGLKEWNDNAVDTKDADAPEIYKLLTANDSPYNIRHSSDPKADFTVNLARAEAHYYKEKASKPPQERANPLKNDKPRAPLGVGGESKADSGKPAPSKISVSKEAEAFAKSMGWDEAKIHAALSTPAPLSFARGRR